MKNHTIISKAAKAVGEEVRSITVVEDQQFGIYQQLWVEAHIDSEEEMEERISSEFNIPENKEPFKVSMPEGEEEHYGQFIVWVEAK